MVGNEYEESTLKDDVNLVLLGWDEPKMTIWEWRKYKLEDGGPEEIARWVLRERIDKREL
jgi:hypothetical protein